MCLAVHSRERIGHEDKAPTEPADALARAVSRSVLGEAVDEGAQELPRQGRVAAELTPNARSAATIGAWPRSREAPAPGPTRSSTRPPSTDYNVFEADRPLVEAVRARGRRLGRASGSRALGAFAGAETRRAWAARQREPADAAHPRPLRPPRRRGRVPPRLARAARGGGRERAALAALARARPGAHVARGGAFMCCRPGRVRGRLPDLDDLLGDPGAAQPARARRRVGTALHHRRLRPAPSSRAREARRARRHGDDREAGRLRRPRQHDDGAADERRRARRRVRADRPQVVLLGADVRRLPRPRPGRRRDLLLPAARAARPTASATASASSGSRTSSATAPTPSARSSSTAPGRSCVGEEGARGADDHRDGQPHPPRLRAAAERRDAGRASRRRSTTPLTARPSASCSPTSR